MFERRILKNLKQWADSKYRKPLILRGARQVGKTTVVNEFGKDFENYLYINLEHEVEYMALCPCSFIEFLGALWMKHRTNGQSEFGVDPILLMK